MTSKPTPPANLWNIEDVSAFLRVPVATLYRWRKVSYGPLAAKVGRELRYDPADVHAWFASRKS
ncbi:helix-turn-helix domain-containing protein [Longispora sp. NPDC051575]|uniref:helix-turn-helix transcriptional regulator n=1 Tax=Longispora sp. NPDC051575 TaxID=3154943 RepID=UPI003441287B